MLNVSTIKSKYELIYILYICFHTCNYIKHITRDITCDKKNNIQIYFLRKKKKKNITIKYQRIRDKNISWGDKNKLS